MKTKKRAILWFMAIIVSAELNCYAGTVPYVLRPLSRAERNIDDAGTTDERVLRILVGPASFAHGTNAATDLVSVIHWPPAVMGIMAQAAGARGLPFAQNLNMLQERLMDVQNDVMLLQGKNAKYIDRVRAGERVTYEEAQPLLGELLRIQRSLNMWRRMFDILRPNLVVLAAFRDEVIEMEKWWNIVDEIIADRIHMMSGEITEDEALLNTVLEDVTDPEQILTLEKWQIDAIEVKGTPVDIYIKGRYRSIMSLVCNSICNAFKHGKATKVWVTLREDLAGGKVILSVKDNGNGFVVDPTTSNKAFHTTGGTGIGLTESRIIVADSEGIMDIVSAPGQGAEFIFTFPLSRIQMAPPTATIVKRVNVIDNQI